MWSSIVTWDCLRAYTITAMRGLVIDLCFWDINLRHAHPSARDNAAIQPSYRVLYFASVRKQCSAVKPTTPSNKHPI